MRKLETKRMYRLYSAAKRVAIVARYNKANFEGLHAVVQTQLQQDVLSGYLFVFCNRARTWIKIMTWEGSGLWLGAKLLERGTFT